MQTQIAPWAASSRGPKAINTDVFLSDLADIHSGDLLQQLWLLRDGGQLGNESRFVVRRDQRDAAAALGKKPCSCVAIDELSPGSHEKNETWLLKAGRSYLRLRTLRVALDGGGETWSNPDGPETWSNDRGHHAVHQNA